MEAKFKSLFGSMLPLVGIPDTIANSMAKYRDLFCREQEFTHVSRYIIGVLLSPNQTKIEKKR